MHEVPSSHHAVRRSRRQALVALFGYAVVLLIGAHSLTVFDDEASIIALAHVDATDTFGRFFFGSGQHEHPPLYDLFLHAWMLVSGSNPVMLRLPSILFYCTGLWLVGATAEILWGRRLLAVLVGVAWPTGFFFGPPAMWTGLMALGVAGVTWSYFAWRRSLQARYLVMFALFGTMLVYTNYYGWAFLGGLGLHFLLSRPSARALAEASAAGLVVLVAFVPVLTALVSELKGGMHLGRSLVTVLAEGVYHGYSTLVSESVAPWAWPAAFAIVGILMLFYVGARTPRVFWLLGLLALVYLGTLSIGILNARRLIMFGPWLILYLTGLLACTRQWRVASIALLLVFGTGWSGILTERWYGTFRHIEPWQEVTSVALALARPGDAIVSSHPSFYFYAGRQLGWTDWRNVTTPVVEKRSGLFFSDLRTWKEAVRASRRVLYVRTAGHPWLPNEDQDFIDFLAKNYRLVSDHHYLEDTSSELKNRFDLHQPRWRIELLEYAPASAAMDPDSNTPIASTSDGGRDGN